MFVNLPPLLILPVTNIHIYIKNMQNIFEMKREIRMITLTTTSIFLFIFIFFYFFFSYFYFLFINKCFCYFLFKVRNAFDTLSREIYEQKKIGKTEKKYSIVWTSNTNFESKRKMEKIQTCAIFFKHHRPNTLVFIWHFVLFLLYP